MKTGRPRTSLVERLQSRIEVRGDDECWPWMGRVSQYGYGSISLGGRDGRQRNAHRVVLELHLGLQLPSGVFACHACDNRRCCNPSHLFAGTHSDNMLDSVAKGRHKNTRKTHCPVGHPYDYQSPVGHRGCRECRKQQTYACRARQEASA